MEIIYLATITRLEFIYLCKRLERDLSTHTRTTCAQTFFYFYFDSLSFDISFSISKLMNSLLFFFFQLFGNFSSLAVDYFENEIVALSFFVVINRDESFGWRKILHV